MCSSARKGLWTHVTVLIMMACVLWGWSVKKFRSNQQVFSLLQSTSEEAKIFTIESSFDLKFVWD